MGNTTSSAQVGPLGAKGSASAGGELGPEHLWDGDGGSHEAEQLLIDALRSGDAEALINAAQQSMACGGIGHVFTPLPELEALSWAAEHFAARVEDLIDARPFHYAHAFDPTPNTSSDVWWEKGFLAPPSSQKQDNAILCLERVLSKGDAESILGARPRRHIEPSS